MGHLFGRALRELYQGLDHPFLIHRDDGLCTPHDLNGYFAKEPTAIEHKALANAQGPILDVGCGAGRSLLWFQTMGLAATGMDHDEGAVALCRMRGCPSVIEGDVLGEWDHGALGPLATITLLGGNIGIGGTFEGARRMLRRLRTLSDGPLELVIVSHDVASTQDPVHLAYHERNQAMGKRPGEVRLQLEYRGMRDEWFEWYHPALAEIEELAAASHWQVKRLDPDDAGHYFAILQCR